MIILVITLFLLLTFVSLYSALRIRRLTLLLEAEKIKGDLAGRKEFFEKLIDAVADPIFVKNNLHQWIYGNKEFTKIINLELKDYIGKSDYDVFPKEMADVFWAKDTETLDDLKTTENEETIMVGGEVRTIVTKKTPVTGMEGGTLLIGVIRDITDRKRQEETIANLYHLIESSSDFYCFCDLTGRPLFINRHGINMGFTTSHEHVRLFFNDSFAWEAIKAQLDQENIWEGEVTMVNLLTAEKVPYWIKIFYVLKENQKPRSISLVGTDIKERKETEIRMFQTSKMASLGEMAGGIAHEINNPLAIISGKAEQIKKYASAGQVDRQKIVLGVEKIEETAFRISKIIRGLKSFSRTDELDPMKEVSLKEMIDETLDLCRERMSSEGITLIQHVDSSLKLVCRATEIEQVLINLLNNSTDALKGQKDPWIKIETASSPGQITVTVTDSGKGIDKVLWAKIMDPFFTTKEVGKGTGLGLSISRRIMESHQGSLVYNEGRTNTSFSLVFNT